MHKAMIFENLILNKMQLVIVYEGSNVLMLSLLTKSIAKKSTLN
jgi:hypothetical protein